MTYKKIRVDLNEQLLKAVARGNANACHHLLEQGANIHAVDEQNWSALHLAAFFGRADACQSLLAHGANADAVTKRGESALHLAAHDGHADICLILLAHGSDPCAKNEENKTAREIAISRTHNSCAHAMDAWVAANAARTALQEISAAATAPTGP